MLVLWIINYRNNPIDHPLVGARETFKIYTGKSVTVSERESSNIPFYRIFFKTSVWALYISVYCFILTAQFNIGFFVMYLVWVLKHQIITAGTIASIPLMIQFIAQLFTGLISDKVTIISERTKVGPFLIKSS